MAVKIGSTDFDGDHEPKPRSRNEKESGNQSFRFIIEAKQTFRISVEAVTRIV